MGSSESTLVKMPHCWKSRVTAHLLFSLIFQTHKSSIMKRPVDLLFILYFFCAGAVDIFRGCVSIFI